MKTQARFTLSSITDATSFRAALDLLHAEVNKRWAYGVGVRLLQGMDTTHASPSDAARHAELLSIWTGLWSHRV